MCVSYKAWGKGTAHFALCHHTLQPVHRTVYKPYVKLLNLLLKPAYGTHLAALQETTTKKDAEPAGVYWQLHVTFAQRLAVYAVQQTCKETMFLWRRERMIATSRLRSSTGLRRLRLPALSAGPLALWASNSTFFTI